MQNVFSWQCPYVTKQILFKETTKNVKKISYVTPFSDRGHNATNLRPRIFFLYINADILTIDQDLHPMHPHLFLP